MASRHRLQRLASPSRTVSALIHLAGILSFSASFRYLVLNPSPVSDSFGGQFQYLTILGLTASLLTFTIGLAADLTDNPRLFAIKNRLSVGSAPLEVLVSILYWGLTAIDKTLVVPPDLILPFLPDFGFHAMPAIMMTLDLLLLSPPWTIRAYPAMALSLVLAFLYWGWVEYCFSKNGWYPYPIFGLLSTWQRVMLFTISATLMTGSTMALKYVYGKLNGIEELKEEGKHPLKAE
ncbi:FAR-17a/AIG1-like protein [Coniochaeta sp. 2T2.1]|nr:FAR-17a/AIG1-like protein [Coniochaeta sp. 2T2.1]